MKPFFLILAALILAACSSQNNGPEISNASTSTGAAVNQDTAKVEEHDKLSLLLAPFGNEQVEGFDVTMQLDAPEAKTGAALLSMPKILVGVPTSAYTAEQVKVYDAKGKLELQVKEEEPTASGQYLSYILPRDTVGAVSYTHLTLPTKRIV